ncbi:MAG: VWD domain-containing protein [Runella sp.]
MKNSFGILFILLLLFSCSKKNLNTELPPEFKFTEPASLALAQQAIITDPSIPVGYVGLFEDVKLQVIAAGKKNTKGEITHLEKIIMINTTNKAWIKYDFNEAFLPFKAESSNSYIIEFNNYSTQNNQVDVVVKKKSDGSVVESKKGEPVYAGNFDLAQKAKAYMTNGIDYTRSSRLSGLQVCDKTIGGIAAGVYIGQNIAACITSGIAFLAAPEAGIIRAVLAGREAYNSCSETKKLIENLQNNRPAFQCPESGESEKSCFTNIVTETGQALQNCGQTVANTWLTKKACECNDEVRFRDLLDGVGSSQGDPHLTTHDGFAYDFMGQGEFVAIQSTTDKLLVQVRQEPLSPNEKRATINTALAARFDKDVVNIFANPFKLLINGETQPSNFISKRLSDNTLLTKSGNQIKLYSVYHDEIIVRVNNHLDFTVNLNSERKGKVRGLLGNYDGNLTNDLILADGKVLTDKTFKGLYPAFADSWRIKQNESLFTYEAGKSTASYTDLKFPYQEFSFTPSAFQTAESRCRQAGVTREPYLSQCIYDVALTGDISFAESAKWTQSLTNYTSLPVSSDLKYFQNVRIEVGSRQNQSDIKNVIDFDTGKTFTLNEAKNNASVDAIAFYDIIQHRITTFALIKWCGISCGVGSLNSLLNSIGWSNWNRGMLFNADGSDRALRLKISNFDFYNVQNANGLANLLQNKLNKNSEYDHAEAILESFERGIDNQHVFAFVTSNGKLGLFRIVGTGLNPLSKITYYDLDIKIQN